MKTLLVMIPARSEGTWDAGVLKPESIFSPDMRFALTLGSGNSASCAARSGERPCSAPFCCPDDPQRTTVV